MVLLKDLSEQTSWGADWEKGVSSASIAPLRVTTGIEDFFLLLALLLSPLKTISCTFVKISPLRSVSLPIANLLTVHNMTHEKVALSDPADRDSTCDVMDGSTK